MNQNYEPETKIEFTATQINEAKEIIKMAIQKSNQCFWPDIVKQNAGRFPAETLLEASRQMQKSKEIRLREDSHEHAMEYILL